MPTTPEVTVSVEKKAGQPTPSVVIPGLGNVVNTFALVGGSATNEKTFIIAGLNLTTPTPATILIQPRQSDNQELGYHDEFAVQVIETGTDHIKVRIKRLDSTVGWGQNLRLDILIIDRANF
jgi:hypothetical protein